MVEHKEFERRLSNWTNKVLKAHKEMCEKSDATVGVNTWSMIVDVDKIVSDGFNQSRALTDD